MHVRMALGIAVGTVLAVVANGQTVYPSTPDWISYDTPVSTGGALVDLDRDGWLDFVVSNGNDMAQEHVAVYYNRGDGMYPPVPDWESTDNMYNGHLDVADVNGDGWPDVAVATLGCGASVGPIARVYLNNNGTLSSLPDWSSNVIGNAFGVAFGDVNNDGRPDLAVGTGWAYNPVRAYHNFVYLNTGTALEATASWMSDDMYHYQGVAWVDVDGDGWLDLAGAASRTRSRLYRNLGGVLEPSPSWQVGDVSFQDAIMVTTGDINGDGVRDLLFADNYQIGGSGEFRLHDGRVGQLPQSWASWTYYDGYCSAVALADVNADGLVDLATGAWWDNTRLFFNEGTAFPTSPNWNSGVTSVVEKITFGDIDKNGLRPVQEVFTPSIAGQRLFYLAHQPIQEIDSVVVDEQPLTPMDFVFSREQGWLTVGSAVASELVVDYTVSSKWDMAVTNWDMDQGNFVYYSQLMVMGDANCDGRVDFEDITPFVRLLSGTYEEIFPDCDGPISCDMDGNGAIDFDDINGFIAALGS